MKKIFEILIIFSILLIIIFMNNLFYKSYLSYELSCKTPELINNETINGMFNTSSCEITIYKEVDTKEYERTLRHELTHYKQLQEKRLYSCNQTLGFIFNEFEAYLSENF